MHDEPFTPRRHGRSLAMLSLSALLLHAAVLGGLQWTWAAADAAPRLEGVQSAAPLQLRIVVDEAPAPSQAQPLGAVPDVPEAHVLAPHRRRGEPLEEARTNAHEEAQTAAPQARPRAVRALPDAARSPSFARDLPTAAPATGAEPSSEFPDAALLALNTEARTHGDAPPATAKAGASANASDVTAPPPPQYRTRIPPAVTLQYELQRGMLRGSGELAWRPDGDHYELKLTGRVGGISALTQVSSGGFDAAGIAPLRFTDQRLARAPMAANFQREAGKVTFSGPSTEFALLPGTQDRLSWMVQLAAIVAADSGLRQPGSTVSMFVVGSRGQGAVYSFRCLGAEAVDTPSGSVAAVKFLREPRDDHDTVIQVWLDPQRHWMPVRARQQSGAGDDEFELRLQSAASTP